VLQLKDDGEEKDDPDPLGEAEMIVKKGDEQHHLSLNAMKGNSGVGTIRFTGRIRKIDVQILVDGDSSDTYLQP
jgi:hypothetical protein